LGNLSRGHVIRPAYLLDPANIEQVDRFLSRFPRFAEFVPAIQLGNKLVPPRTHMVYQKENHPCGGSSFCGIWMN